MSVVQLWSVTPLIKTITQIQLSAFYSHEHDVQIFLFLTLGFSHTWLPSSLCQQFLSFFFGLLCTLGQQLVVLGLVFPILLHPVPFLGHETSTTLQPLWSDQPLNLGRFGLLLLSFFNRKWTSDDELSHIIFLAEVEQLSDFVGTFRTQPSWHDSVGKAWDLLLAFFHNHQVKDAQLGINNAPSDWPAFALASSSWAITGVTFRQEKSDSAIRHNALFHGESLFVISTTYTNHIALHKGILHMLQLLE